MARDASAVERRAGASTQESRALQVVFGAGVLLRIVTFFFLEPSNNDPHWEVIEFILAQGRLPNSIELVVSHHPPLYYLLAVPLATIGTAKLVQALSLLFSLGTLYLIYRLVKTTALLPTQRSKFHALLLTSILPQFVLFGLFISNDGLSFAVGTLCFVQAFRYIDRPSRGNLALLGTVLGVGLLTKGTFLAFGPPLVGVVVLTEARKRLGWARMIGALLVFGACFTLVGSYKYVENTIQLGTPVPTVEDAPSSVWTTVIERQLEDPRSRLGPGLLYLTFWYSYIEESNFTATRSPRAFPGVIYLLALAPTLVMIAVFGQMVWRNRSPGLLLTTSESDFGFRMREWLVVVALLFHVLLVLTWGLQHGGPWSFYQARLAFSAFFPVAILFGRGFEAAQRWHPLAGRWMERSVVVLYLFFAAYYAVEIGSQIVRG